MKKQQYYFKDEDSEICYPLSIHLEEAEQEDLTEITLFKAIRSKDKDVYWCRHYQTVGESRGSGCGKACPAYKPRNGKSGICTHSAKTYEGEEQVTFSKVNGKWTEVKTKNQVA